MLQLCKITDSLFISNARSACSDELLSQEGVTMCINVSKQQPFPNLRISTLRVPVYDDPGENLYKYFDRCADAIESTANSAGCSVVYCKNGRSRSASICVAYLMKHKGCPCRTPLTLSRQPALWWSPTKGSGDSFRDTRELEGRRSTDSTNGDPLNNGQSSQQQEAALGQHKT